MSLTIKNYKGYPILSPDPNTGTPARAINDAIKGLADTSVQVIGTFSATNFEGAFAHFKQEYYGNGSAGFFWESTTPFFGGLFPAAGASNTMAFNSCRERLAFAVGCNWNSCGGCWYNGTEVPFSLCAVNAENISVFSVNMLDFGLRPVALQSMTSLVTLRLNHFTFVNDSLTIANLNSLNQITLHINLSGSSTLSINNLSSLTSLWMSGESYGGMRNLTDANFTLDIAILPDIRYIALYNIGSGLSTAFFDTLLIALANSVVSNPRTGFIDISGSGISNTGNVPNNAPSGASASAISYLTGPGGWTVTHN